MFDYLRTGLVPRLPTAVLATGMIVLASLSVVSGVILEAINYFFLAKRQQITRLSADIESAEEEILRLKQQIREATRF